MKFCSFRRRDLITVSDALDVAEDATGNFYKFSADQWKRHRYEVKTLLSLSRDEISQEVFALLNREPITVTNSKSTINRYDLYFICLQDHQILKALTRDRDLCLLPLLVYVFTHEFVHIVRFSNFFQRYDASQNERDREEKIVHRTTFEILQYLSLPKLDYVLNSYQGHRLCDMVLP